MRRALPVVLASLVVLGAGLTSVWYWAEGLAARQWDAQVAALRAQGVRVEAGPPARAGWPVALGLDVPDVRVELPDGELPGGATWRAERLAVRVEAWRPDTLVFFPAGRQSLRLGALPLVPYQADGLQARMPLGGGETLLSARTLRIAAPRPVLLSGVVATLAGHALRFAANGIELPGTELPPVRMVSLDAALSAPLPPPGPDPVRRLSAWRDAGGTAVLRRLALQWGNADAVAEGKGGVDARVQPVAEGTVRVHGAAEAVPALAAAGYLTPGQATAVRALLGFLSRPAPDGGPPVAELPFALRDGILTMSNIPVARVVVPGWPEN